MGRGKGLHAAQLLCNFTFFSPTVIFARYACATVHNYCVFIHMLFTRSTIALQFLFGPSSICGSLSAFPFSVCLFTPISTLFYLFLSLSFQFFFYFWGSSYSMSPLLSNCSNFQPVELSTWPVFILLTSIAAYRVSNGFIFAICLHSTAVTIILCLIWASEFPSSVLWVKTLESVTSVCSMNSDLWV